MTKNEQNRVQRDNTEVERDSRMASPDFGSAWSADSADLPLMHDFSFKVKMFNARRRRSEARAKSESYRKDPRGHNSVPGLPGR